MRESDLNNILFVLSLQPKDVSAWLHSFSDENELKYALSIIECANWFLLDEAIQRAEDCKLANKILGEIFHAY